LYDEGVVFDVIVSATEQIFDYIPHYNQIIALLHNISEYNSKSGSKKPLVLFTSGCKDYGMSPLFANSPGLAPDTEESPLAPPPFATDRANYAIKTFEHMEKFDAVVLRPTNVYGGGSSFYAGHFLLGTQAREKGFLELNEDLLTMLHALHVDDCGDAYVALAETGLKDRKSVSGECFNISSYRYETLQEIAEALVKEYGIEGGVKIKKDVWPEGDRPDVNLTRALFGFSQWVGSEKVRRLAGWKDTRPLFSKALKQYRLAFEAAALTDSKMQRLGQRTNPFVGAVVRDGAGILSEQK
jgi:nucleoside-diphosphate-sugar epimerase